MRRGPKQPPTLITLHLTMTLTLSDLKGLKIFPFPTNFQNLNRTKNASYYDLMNAYDNLVLDPNVKQKLAQNGSEVLLGTLTGANMNATTDQAITINKQNITSRYVITKIIVTNASISLTTAAGGIYPAASKGGTAIVAAAQAYSALTSANHVLNATLAVNLSYTLDTIYLSLTTAQGAAATADVRVYGYFLN